MKNIIKITIFISIFSFIFSSCVKENFDVVPEKKYSTNLVANTTIAQLKNDALFSGTIPDSVIIKGTVISSDEFSNFHKELIIQDSTAGIKINVASYSLFRGFPIGRMVYVKCKGLHIRKYKGTKEINFISNGSLADIPQKVMDTTLFRSEEGIPIIPKAVKISELNDNYLNTLIKLEGVEFVESDTALNFITEGNTFEEAYGSDRTIIDFSENNMVIRTSPYSDFKNEAVPDGNGTVTAIYSKYRETYQLVLRSTDDLNLNNNRIERTYLFEENFVSDLGSFTSYDVTGSKNWYHASYGGETYAIISGYNGGANEDWLISPAMDLSSNENVSLNFRHAVGHLKTWDDMTVWVSTDYDGTSNPNESGTWNEITGFNKPIPSGNWSSFESSGGLDFSEYAGNSSVYIAFRYVCSATAASTWEIATVKIIVQ